MLFFFVFNCNISISQLNYKTNNCLFTHLLEDREITNLARITDVQFGPRFQGIYLMLNYFLLGSLKVHAHWNITLKSNKSVHERVCFSTWVIVLFANSYMYENAEDESNYEKILYNNWYLTDKWENASLFLIYFHVY